MLTLALGGLMVGALAFGANAQITQTLNYGSAGSPINTTFNSTLTFNQFDTVGGTLTLDSVVITLSASNVQSYNLINNDSTTHAYNNIETVGKTFLRDAGPFPFGNNLLLPVVNDQTFFSGSGVINPGDNIAFGPFTLTNSSTNTLTSGAAYLSFIGLGTISTFVQGIGTDSSVGDSNLSYNPHTSGYGSVTVVYNYHATGVPEPGSAALLIGMGVTGAGILVRFRKRNRA